MRRDSGALFILLFVIYALTAPHAVTLEDSGEFIMTSYYWGVSHPPGYPLYTLLGKLFSYLPFSTVAYRIHLISALFASLSCVMVYLCGLKILNHRYVAVGAALVYGFSLTFWSQAVVAEVYALNAFFFLALLYLALELSEGVSKKLVATFALCFGLSLANHWPLILLNFPMLLVLLWPNRNLFFRFWTAGLGFFALGLVPYVIMVWRASREGEMIFSGAIANFSEFVNYVIRKEYMGLEASGTATLWDSAQFFGQFLFRVLSEFTYIGAAVLLVGFYAAAKSFPGKLKFVFIWGILSSSLILKFFEVNDFEPLNVEAYLVYHLIPYAFLALAIGAGTLEINKRLPKVPAWVVPLSLAVLVLCLNFTKSNRRSEDFALRYAEVVLKNLPENAKLFVSAETDAGPIGYAHYVERIRPDIKLFSQFGLLFKNRMLDPVNDRPETKASKSKGFFKANAPVYFSSPLFFIDGNSVNGLTATKRGLYTVLSSAPAEPNSEKLNNAVKEFLDIELKRPYDGIWNYHAGSIYTYLCSTLAQAKIQHEFAKQNSFCLLQYAAEEFNSSDFAGADEMLQKLVVGLPFLNKPEQSQVANLFAQNRINLINSQNPSVEVRTLRYAQVGQFLRQALEKFPSCENSVLKTIVTLDKQAGIPADDIFIQKRFSNCRL